MHDNYHSVPLQALITEGMEKSKEVGGSAPFSSTRFSPGVQLLQVIIEVRIGPRVRIFVFVVIHDLRVFLLY